MILEGFFHHWCPHILASDVRDHLIKRVSIVQSWLLDPPAFRSGSCSSKLSITLHANAYVYPLQQGAAQAVYLLCLMVCVPADGIYVACGIICTIL